MSSQSIAGRLVIPFAQAPMSLALRGLCLTFALTLAVLAIVGYWSGTRGYELLIVAMGWPHIILGFLFYFGKVLRNEWRARSSFFLLTLLTLALWTTHYVYTITGFISIYFTYHVFRDEVFIYFQRRARHKLRDAVNVAGFIPFILLMFIITDPRPQHYRQDLRRVELTDADLSGGNWTRISFEPISYSRGKDFYFYLQAPKTNGDYTTLATRNDTRTGGEIRIADKKWSQAGDLVFKPYYATDQNGGSGQFSASNDTVPVSLTGEYRVGETFRAEHDNLAGIWIPIMRTADKGPSAKLVFHLTPDTSLPLPPLSPVLKALRLALIAILLVIALWRAVPHLKQNRAFWLYFGFLLAVFAALQKTIQGGASAGYEFPIMFQLVVIFHYWSWYVFSFDKLRAFLGGAPPPPAVTLYDRLLGRLRDFSHFTFLVIGLNLVSLAGVLWYTKLSGPAPLRYLFDYNYFLYFLVLHVTFSFGPRQASRQAVVGRQ